LNMKKILLLFVLIILSATVGFSLASNNFWENKDSEKGQPLIKKPILRFALVSDSEGENELLAKALEQAKGKGVNFIVGLGDWSTVGTLDQLADTKKVFDNSKLEYFVTAGDHDLWASRERQEDSLTNFRQVFGESSTMIERENVLFVILDNSDIYKGISNEDWEIFSKSVSQWIRKPENQKTSGSESESPDHWNTNSPTYRITDTPKLTFVFAHKTPFHPESKHVMGEGSRQVAKQAQNLLALLENSKVDGFFSGDLHFFAQFKSSDEAVKITTIGAVASERNFQGPRFAIVTVWEDYSWEVEDVEIR